MGKTTLSVCGHESHKPTVSGESGYYFTTTINDEGDEVLAGLTVSESQFFLSFDQAPNDGQQALQNADMLGT